MNTITELKNSTKASTADQIKQKKQSINSKTGHLKVSSERHENKKEEKERRKPIELMGQHDKK